MENEEKVAEEETVLQEATHNDDIGTAEFSFNQLVKAFQEGSTNSLIREVAATVPMKYSTGSIVNIRKQSANNSFETVQANLTVNTATSNPIQSGLSIEAITDLQNQYGMDGYENAGNLLKTITDASFLDTNSLSTAALTLSNAGSAEPSLFEITQRVQELIIKMNTPNFRTFEAWVILPYKNAASISALSHYARGIEETDKKLVLNKMGQTRYYVNPDTSASTAFVGLKSSDKNSIGASSVIMGTFAQELVRATHVEFTPKSEKVIPHILKAIDKVDDSMSITDFALAVTKIVQNEYGSHLYDDFKQIVKIKLKKG